MVKILGISGSPRKKANTDIMLEKALEGAAGIEDVETEFLSLADKDIRLCKGCFACWTNEEATGICPVHKDDMDEIYQKLMACDGLILASPVYFGGVSSLMKAFMDRTEPLLRYTTGPKRGGLKSKVGGAISIGGNRNGGEETTIEQIHHYYFIHDMIVVGTSTEGRPGCYLGAAGTTHPDRGFVRDAVQNDELALNAAFHLGKRVAAVAKVLKDASL